MVYKSYFMGLWEYMYGPKFSFWTRELLSSIKRITFVSSNCWSCTCELLLAHQDVLQNNILAGASLEKKKRHPTKQLCQVMPKGTFSIHWCKYHTSWNSWQLPEVKVGEESPTTPGIISLQTITMMNTGSSLSWHSGNRSCNCWAYPSAHYRTGWRICTQNIFTNTVYKWGS